MKRSSTFLRFLSYIRPYWKFIFAALFSLAIATVLNLSVPWIIGVMLIDQVILFGNTDLLDLVLTAFIGVILAKEVFAYFNEYFLEILTQKMAHRLRTDLYDHLQYVPLSLFDRSQTGDLLARMSGDVDTVADTVRSLVTDVGSDLVMLIGTLVFLFFLNAPLTLIIFPTLPVLAVTIYLFKRRIKRSSKQIRNAIGALMAKATEVLSGIRVVKSFVKEEHESKMFARKSLGILRSRVSLVRLSAAYSSTVHLVILAGMVLVIWIGTPLAVAGTFSIGSFFVYLNFLRKLHAPVKGLSKTNFKIQKALAAGDRIFEVNNMCREPVRSGLMELPPVKGHVRFKNVSFAYEGENYVLKNFSLEVEPGEAVAIVGSSGAGKTTIINLLLRFYELKHGEITIDGYPMNEVNPQSLRRQIGLVSQETFLFSGTIKENISYGNLAASDQEIQQAAKLANAHDFIVSLPKSYDTEIGERGVRLSSGQKQRISIARTILKNPKILILDEATSNVDTESESLIQDALKRVMKGRTTFIIGHRLTAISRAHKVVAIYQGEAVEVGTHEELLNKKGIYAKLFALQRAEPKI